MEQDFQYLDTGQHAMESLIFLSEITNMMQPLADVMFEGNEHAKGATILTKVRTLSINEVIMQKVLFVNIQETIIPNC